MLSFEKEQSMTRKEYIKFKKNSRKRAPWLKNLVLVVIIIVLSIYVINQLKVYTTMTEMANKVIEESKLIKTYNMYFVSKPYVKGDESILYYYKGENESRKELTSGVGLSKIQYKDGYLYGVKDGNLIKLDVKTEEQVILVEGNVSQYVLTYDDILVYKYSQKDRNINGVYSLKNSNRIIEGVVYQMGVTKNKCFVVMPDVTSRSLVSYDLNGNNKKVLSEKYIVSSIILKDDYVFFSNSTKENCIFKVRQDGSNIEQVTKGSTIVEKERMDASFIMDVYQGNLIFINETDNKVYITSKGEEKILVDNEVKSIELRDNMLYFLLKNKIELYRLNLTNNELDKITSIRADEYIFTSN